MEGATVLHETTMHELHREKKYECGYFLDWLWKQLMITLIECFNNNPSNESFFRNGIVGSNPLYKEVIWELRQTTKCSKQRRP
jgi:hypothetical protein